jgi:hypothetical protein
MVEHRPDCDPSAGWFIDPTAVTVSPRPGLAAGVSVNQKNPT